MLKQLMQFFEAPPEQPQKEDLTQRVAVATCALLVEMAQSDDDFSQMEREHIVEILCGHFSLTRENAEAVIESARQELKESVELWHFTHCINENYSITEKEQVIEMVWRVIYADGKLDKYEDYLVHRLGKLLNLNHKQLIDAKVKVLSSESPD